MNDLPIKNFKGGRADRIAIVSWEGEDISNEIHDPMDEEGKIVYSRSEFGLLQLVFQKRLEPPNEWLNHKSAEKQKLFREKARVHPRNDVACLV